LRETGRSDADQLVKKFCTCSRSRWANEATTGS
jgi:hypothetical protein